MDVKPAFSSTAQPGQRVSDTGNFKADLPSIGARQAAVPVQTVNAVQQTAEVPAMGEVDSAVQKINEAMKSMSRNLEFSVDSDSNRAVVKVIDQETHEVIRQMPTPEAIEIAKALDRLQGLLVRNKA